MGRKKISAYLKQYKLKARLAAKRILKHPNARPIDITKAQMFLSNKKPTRQEQMDLMYWWRGVKSTGSKKSLVGQRFGKLVAQQVMVRRAKDRQLIYKCKCDCGRIHKVAKRYLVEGKSKSCGCLPKNTKQLKE